MVTQLAASKPLTYKRFPVSPWLRRRCSPPPITYPATRPTRWTVTAAAPIRPGGSGGRTRRAGGCRRGARVRLGHGRHQRRATHAGEARFDRGGAGRRLLPSASLRPRGPGARGGDGHRGIECADLRRGRGSGRGAGRNAHQSGVGCDRSAPVGHHLPRAQRTLGRRQHRRTPLGQQPLSLGADAVVASATKALSGHGDLLAGYVATSQPELLAAVERHRLLAGAILGGFEAWLLLRSLATAGLRFERQCQNARAVATMLARQPGVRAVRYPGLADDPAHPVAMAQMRRLERWSRWNWPTRTRCMRSWTAANCSSPPPVSGACTHRWTAGRAGRSGDRRICAHLAGHRGHRRPARRHRTSADAVPLIEISWASTPPKSVRIARAALSWAR